ncbi:MAG: glycine-rich domain-containing protein-like [Cyanobacteria bacterium J06576_12]
MPQTPTRTIAKTNRVFLAKLSTIDFGPIAYKLMHPEEGEAWNIERVTRAIEQYRRFLFLSKHYPERKIVPSREVDQVWHMHILDTAKYREDCDTLFDQFMDHWPYFGMKDEAERAELNDAFSDTQRLMEAHFGKR